MAEDRSRRRFAMVLLALAALCFSAFLPAAASAQPAPPNKLAVIPPDKDSDLKFYNRDGTILKGVAALEKMHAADLSLWVAGNQFFAMDEVIGRFQKAHPGLTVGLITLPPGLILAAILGGGWSYDGKDYAGTPDIFASVNLGHLRQLWKNGLMTSYVVYMHNELQIMVAKGNPKKIDGIDDLVRADVRTSMPNPVNEGIMQFYARPVLERHGIWLKISDGKECVACQTTANNRFTAVHHRETPERILAGTSDAGIVWKTEVLAAQRGGAEVSAVELPAEDSLRDEVSYAIGALANSPHQQTAAAYLHWLATPDAQEAYAGFGFVKASADELRLKAIE